MKTTAVTVSSTKKQRNMAEDTDVCRTEMVFIRCQKSQLALSSMTGVRLPAELFLLAVNIELLVQPEDAQYCP
jgi:hypothetical protein